MNYHCIGVILPHIKRNFYLFFSNFLVKKGIYRIKLGSECLLGSDLWSKSDGNRRHQNREGWDFQDVLLAI